jgi:hypothetical protein
MTVNNVQTQHGTSATLAFTPSAVGDLVVVCVSLTNSTATMVVSGLGITWTRAARSNPASASGVSEIWYGTAVNTTAGTITATITGTYSQVRQAAGEFSGPSGCAWALDSAQASASTSAFSHNKSPQIAATNAGELYVWNMSLDQDTLVYQDASVPTANWASFGAGDHYQKAWYNTTVAGGGVTLSEFSWHVSGTTIHEAQVAAMFMATGAPLTPDLNSPSPSDYVDTTSGVTFDWDYNTGGSDTQQEGYQLRLKPSGGSYQYWNAATPGWQGSPVTNTTTATNVTIPNSASLTNGNVYNWSVATSDNGGLGAFASDATFTANGAPTITPLTPSGVIAIATPIVTWSEVLAAGATQSAFRVITYNASQYGAGGFTPGFGPHVDDSGGVSSAATTYTISNPLVPGVSYRSYITIIQSPGNQVTYDYAAFDYEIEGPAKPVVTAVPVDTPLSGLPCIALTVQGRDNWLTYAEAEAGGLSTTGWIAGANTTLSATSSGALDSLDAMLLHATAGGSVSAHTATGTGGFPVAPSTAVRALASFHATSVSRSCTIKVLWWQASGAASAIRASDTSAPVTSPTSGYIQASLQVTAPADAAFASLELDAASLGASETLEVDEILLGPGTGTDWFRGGLVGTTWVTVLRSDGVYVAGAGPSDMLPFPDAGQVLALNDFGAVNYQHYTYSAQVLCVIGGDTVSSPISAASADVVLIPTQWWIWPINNPAAALGLHRASKVSATVTTGGDASMQFDKTELQAQFQPMGRPDYVIVHGDMKDENFMLSLVFFGNDEWNAFDALRNLQTDMAIRSDLDGEIYFVAFDTARPAVLLRGDLYSGEPVRQCDIKFWPIAKPII